jgi:hypothetical protein
MSTEAISPLRRRMIEDMSSHRCAAFNSRHATNPGARCPDRSFTTTQATVLRGKPIAATVTIQPQQA